MKLLVISDTHTDKNFIQKLNKKYPDMDYYIHCGDSELSENDPDIKNYITVRGNNDYDFPKEFILKIKNFSILIIHGHLQNPYLNFKTLANYAKSKNANIVLFGHIHIPVYESVDDIIIINPGSTYLPRNSKIGTYAIITIDTTLEIQFYNINHEQLFK